MDTVSTEAFCKASNNTFLSTEASMIDWPPLYAPEMFTLTSEWTNRSIAMKKTYTEMSDEGDVILWLYKPANENANIDLTVEVFND